MTTQEYPIGSILYYGKGKGALQPKTYNACIVLPEFMCYVTARDGALVGEHMSLVDWLIIHWVTPNHDGLGFALIVLAPPKGMDARIKMLLAMEKEAKAEGKADAKGDVIVMDEIDEFADMPELIPLSSLHLPLPLPSEPLPLPLPLPYSFQRSKRGARQRQRRAKKQRQKQWEQWEKWEQWEQWQEKQKQVAEAGAEAEAEEGEVNYMVTQKQKQKQKEQEQKEQEQKEQEQEEQNQKPLCAWEQRFLVAGCQCWDCVS